MVGGRTPRLIGLFLTAACASIALGSGRHTAGEEPVRAALTRIVADAAETAGPSTALSVWLGTDEEAWISTDAEVIRPAASAIKPAILIELMSKYEENLDQLLECGREVLEDADHPALRHYSAEDRTEVAAALAGASARRIGEIMIHGRGVSNAVYNAATNLAIADLGGPARVTEAIHRRDPSFRGLAVRRYMLADRAATGDNTATAASLAAVLQRLAARDVPGLTPATVEAVRAALELEADSEQGAHFFKSGALDSSPPVRIRSGWYERDGRALVYVVVASRAEGPAFGLEEVAVELAEALITRAWAELTSAEEPSESSQRTRTSRFFTPIVPCIEFP